MNLANTVNTAMLGSEVQQNAPLPGSEFEVFCQAWWAGKQINEEVNPTEIINPGRFWLKESKTSKLQGDSYLEFTNMKLRSEGPGIAPTGKEETFKIEYNKGNYASILRCQALLNDWNLAHFLQEVVMANHLEKCCRDKTGYYGLEVTRHTEHKEISKAVDKFHEVLGQDKSNEEYQVVNFSPHDLEMITTVIDCDDLPEANTIFVLGNQSRSAAAAAEMTYPEEITPTITVKNATPTSTAASRKRARKVEKIKAKKQAKAIKNMVFEDVDPQHKGKVPGDAADQEDTIEHAKEEKDVHSPDLQQADVQVEEPALQENVLPEVMEKQPVFQEADMPSNTPQSIEAAYSYEDRANEDEWKTVKHKQKTKTILNNHGVIRSQPTRRVAISSQTFVPPTQSTRAPSSGTSVGPLRSVNVPKDPSKSSSDKTTAQKAPEVKQLLKKEVVKSPELKVEDDTEFPPLGFITPKDDNAATLTFKKIASSPKIESLNKSEPLIELFNEPEPQIDVPNESEPLIEISDPNPLSKSQRKRANRAARKFKEAEDLEAVNTVKEQVIIAKDTNIVELPSQNASYAAPVEDAKDDIIDNGIGNEPNPTTEEDQVSNGKEDFSGADIKENLEISLETSLPSLEDAEAAGEDEKTANSLQDSTSMWNELGEIIISKTRRPPPPEVESVTDSSSVYETTFPEAKITAEDNPAASAALDQSALSVETSRLEATEAYIDKYLFFTDLTSPSKIQSVNRRTSSLPIARTTKKLSSDIFVRPTEEKVTNTYRNVVSQEVKAIQFGEHVAIAVATPTELPPTFRPSGPTVRENPIHNSYSQDAHLAGNFMEGQSYRHVNYGPMVYPQTRQMIPINSYAGPYIGYGTGYSSGYGTNYGTSYGPGYGMRTGPSFTSYSSQSYDSSGQAAGTPSKGGATSGTTGATGSAPIDGAKSISQMDGGSSDKSSGGFSPPRMMSQGPVNPSLPVTTLTCTSCSLRVTATDRNPGFLCAYCGVHCNIRYCSVVCLLADSVYHAPRCIGIGQPNRLTAFNPPATIVFEQRPIQYYDRSEETPGKFRQRCYHMYAFAGMFPEVVQAWGLKGPTEAERIARFTLEGNLKKTGQYYIFRSAISARGAVPIPVEVICVRFHSVYFLSNFTNPLFQTIRFPRSDPLKWMINRCLCVLFVKNDMTVANFLYRMLRSIIAQLDQYEFYSWPVGATQHEILDEFNHQFAQEFGLPTAGRENEVTAVDPFYEWYRTAAPIVEWYESENEDIKRWSLRTERDL